MEGEVDKALFLTDLEIAHSYAPLVSNETVCDQMFSAIETEYQLACKGV